jgi:hypothetical protein
MLYKDEDGLIRKLLGIKDYRGITRRIVGTPR